MERQSIWLPHPLLSLLLLLLWLLLNNSATPGHLMLGALIGLLIPRFTRRFWPERLGLARPALPGGSYQAPPGQARCMLTKGPRSTEAR